MALRRRARKDEHKQERRAAILAVALRMFEQGSFRTLTMAEVARKAGLAKGTVYLYFRSKEELFLSVLQDLLAGWFDAVDARLAALRAVATTAEVARTVSSTIVERPELTRLLTILHTALEQNVARDAARRFKQMLLGRILTTGRRLESRLPFLGKGGGARLLMRVDALVIGLRQMADPAPVVRQVLDEPGMEVFKVDFGREFQASLLAVLRGLEADATKGRR